MSIKFDLQFLSSGGGDQIIRQCCADYRAGTSLANDETFFAQLIENSFQGPSGNSPSLRKRTRGGQRFAGLEPAGTDQMFKETAQKLMFGGQRMFGQFERQD